MRRGSRLRARSMMPTEPWRRFTLLDALVLIAALATGFALARPFETPHWERGLRAGIYLFSGLALGICITGPVLLASQWAFRGRRARPGRGEWPWLIVAVPLQVAYLLALIPPQARPKILDVSLRAFLFLNSFFCALMALLSPLFLMA